MIRIRKLTHCFMPSIPRELDPGTLYVSMEYGTAVHSCCCGCGEQVVTPFSPTDWKMTYDGRSVSLTPSIGNWQLPCRSHYVIREGTIVEAGSWSSAQVNAEQKRDKAAKARFYSTQASSVSEEDTQTTVKEMSAKPAHRIRSFWSAIVTLFTDDQPKK